MPRLNSESRSRSVVNTNKLSSNDNISISSISDDCVDVTGRAVLWAAGGSSSSSSSEGCATQSMSPSLQTRFLSLPHQVACNAPFLSSRAQPGATTHTLDAWHTHWPEHRDDGHYGRMLRKPSRQCRPPAEAPSPSRSRPPLFVYLDGHQAAPVASLQLFRNCWWKLFTFCFVLFVSTPGDD